MTSKGYIFCTVLNEVVDICSMSYRHNTLFLRYYSFLLKPFLTRALSDRDLRLGYILEDCHGQVLTCDESTSQ